MTQKVKTVHYEVSCGSCNKIVMMQGSIDDFNNVLGCPRCGSYQVKPTIAKIVYEEQDEKQGD